MFNSIFTTKDTKDTKIGRAEEQQSRRAVDVDRTLCLLLSCSSALLLFLRVLCGSKSIFFASFAPLRETRLS
jgi:hypothetical protein